jgi:probable phosphoglycerate mutase
VKLFLVRHGESQWNVEGRYQGWLDPPLSELGLRQAQAVAQRLARVERPSRIVSSPQDRATNTAEAIAQACGASLVLDRRLMEISHGEWEGLLRSEVAQRWPDVLAQWKSDPQAVRFPGGESLEDVRVRWQSFLTDLDVSDTPLVAVTHDIIIRLACMQAQAAPMNAFFNLKVDNGGITELRWQDSELSSVGFNDVSHLEGLRADLSRQAL